jgi:hypothetical protein
MVCVDKKCRCKPDYRWERDQCKKMTKCSENNDCQDYDLNRNCDSFNGIILCYVKTIFIELLFNFHFLIGKCVCKFGYKEQYESKKCIEEDECVDSLDCSMNKPRCSGGKCQCWSGYTYDYSLDSCEYSVSWAYYLWFLMIIPIAIVAFSIYFICRRRRMTPGAVIISNNRTFAQQYGQQYPNAPPPYTEPNTYRY